MDDGSSLGMRLRALRDQTWDDIRVNQRHLSGALGISGALISSWENDQAVPPEDRLNAYARFFATRRSMQQTPPALVPSEDLTPEEERQRQRLIDELFQLREEALATDTTAPRDRGALGGRFWYFPDGQPITIVCSPLSNDQLGYTAEARATGTVLPATQYSTNTTHPNYVRHLGNADVDSLVELVGHIRAENPTATVTWTTHDRMTATDLMRGHLVVLGLGDYEETPLASQVMGGVFSEFKDLLRIPIRPAWPKSGEGGEPEFDAWFEVRTKEGVPDPEGNEIATYRPRFIRDETQQGRPRLLNQGAPQLESDIALIVRKSNPLNAAAKVTLFGGLFSRGTYGSVRAFTHSQFRARNETWLSGSLNPDDFWMLIQVTVFGGEKTITPDLSRASSRLMTSA